MKEQIRAFLKENGAAPEMTEYSDSESLLEAGVIDSAAMIDLITFLEKTYKVSIDEDDMIPENFDSIDAIVDYIGSRITA